MVQAKIPRVELQRCRLCPEFASKKWTESARATEHVVRLAPRWTSDTVPSLAEVLGKVRKIGRLFDHFEHFRMEEGGEAEAWQEEPGEENDGGWYDWLTMDEVTGLPRMAREK